ncbi:MAG: carboxyl transferase [Clostridiales bacterium]|nr:carboxyl transferase [Clostridiales bacterium]
MSNSTQTSAIDRITALLDDGSFVEVGSYVTARSTDFNLTDKETPADGVITGYGTINGCLVYVYSQDAAVLGGSLGEMHAKKISNIYSMAIKMGAPVVGLIDCAGLRLQEATDALNGFGQVYFSQAMASGVVPQIAAIFGTCGGGMAVSAAMADFIFMESKKAKLFVNSPNAIAGNRAEVCDTSKADFQSKEAGLVDFTGTEDEVLTGIRELISVLPANNEDDLSYEECTDDLNRTIDDMANYVGASDLGLAQISDNNFFVEVKKAYAPEMVTGFIRLNGCTVGCVANRTEEYDENGEKSAEYEAVLSANGCEKAAKFLSFCDAFNIPVLTLVNVKGYKASKCTERRIAKSAGRLTYAYANASVPKITVVTGIAYGTAYLVMGSKALGADIVYAWPDAQIGMMDAQAAAKIMYADEIDKADDSVALINEKAAAYRELQSSAVSAAKRGYVDDIIEAGDTRKRVIAAFEMLYTKREDRPDRKHGTV